MRCPDKFNLLWDHIPNNTSMFNLDFTAVGPLWHENSATCATCTHTHSTCFKGLEKTSATKLHASDMLPVRFGVAAAPGPGPQLL